MFFFLSFLFMYNYFIFISPPPPPPRICVWVGGLHNKPCVSVSVSVSLSPLKIQICTCPTLLISYVAKIQTVIVFCFVLKMYFSLPQLFVYLYDVLSVAVLVIRDRFVKKIIIRLVLKSLSLCNKVLVGPATPSAENTEPKEFLAFTAGVSEYSF